MPDVIFEGDRSLERKLFAAFGELSYRLTDSLEAILGLRWFDATLDVETVQRGGDDLGDNT